MKKTKKRGYGIGIVALIWWLMIVLGVNFPFLKYDDKKQPSVDLVVDAGTIQTGGLKEEEISSGVVLDVVKEVQQSSRSNPQRSLLQEIMILQALYKQNPTIELLQSLVSKLVQNYQFDDAYGLLSQIYEQGKIDLFDPYLFLYVVMNTQLDLTSNQKIQDVIELVQLFTSEKKISKSDQQFFLALIELMKGNIQVFYQYLQEVEESKYQSFKDQVRKQQQLATTQLGAPQYYEQALLSLVVLKYGYAKIAMNVAATIAITDPGYILPQQILAYGYLMTNQRQLAIDHLLQLKELDIRQKDYYTMMLGMASYRKGKPEDALLYLTQAQKTLDSLDILRTMLLSYIALDQYQQIPTITKQLLSKGVELTRQDYLLMFDQIFFEPYKQGKSDEIYSSNPVVFLSLLSSCKNVLAEKDQAVCKYGQAGQFLVTNEQKKAEILLESLIQEFPSSVLYQALGAIAFQQKMYEKAKNRYIKAATIATPSQQIAIKKVLLKIETINTPN